MSHRHADVASLRMLRKARDRIDRDYREEIGIEALARGAGYSREHFIRAFRAAYGETPGRYRTRRRVERARELLRSRYRAEAASRGEAGAHSGVLRADVGDGPAGRERREDSTSGEAAAAPGRVASGT